MKTRTITVMLALLMATALSGQEKNNSVTYAFGAYESRFGDYYGIGICSENIFFEGGIGGVMMNKIKKSMEHDTGIPSENHKGVNWNITGGYILGEDKGQGAYLGLGYTSVNYSWNFSFWPKPFDDTGGKFVNSTIDLIAGYSIIEKENIYFDVRIGYGIGIINKFNILWQGDEYNINDFTKEFIKYIPEEYAPDPIDMSNMLSKFFFSVKIGYSF